jgi:diaminohydroxyphosphoribosylaminopyrimidine deaminase/5-amino-6-(5-phosphoribosylamino)uracil reductase
MVGINTVLRDDPRLTVRLDGKKGPDPVRIIIDSKGRLPLESRIVKTASETKTILATTEFAPPNKLEALRSCGVGVMILPSKRDRVDLQEVMSALGEKEISNILVEGGGTLNYSLLAENIIDKFYIFIAPLLIGGEKAPTLLEGTGVGALEEAWAVENIEMKQLDNDLLIIGYPVRRKEVVYRDSGRIGGSIRSATC